MIFVKTGVILLIATATKGWLMAPKNTQRHLYNCKNEQKKNIYNIKTTITYISNNK